MEAQAGNESATISWHAPEKNPAASPLDGEPPCGCKEVSNYTVFINGEEHETTGTQITIPNLTNGKTYTVTVRANADPGKPFDSRETEPITVTPEGMSPFPMSYTMTVDGHLAGYSCEGCEIGNLLGADVTITGTQSVGECATVSYCEYRAETLTGTDYGYIPLTGGSCSFPLTVNLADEPNYLDGDPMLVLGERDGAIKGALDFTTHVQPPNHEECFAGLGLGTEGAFNDGSPASNWPLTQTVSPGAETSTWSVVSPQPEFGAYFDGVITITWHW